MASQKTENETQTKQAAVPWVYHKFFKYAVGTLLVLTIILVFYQVAFFLRPIFDFVSILFVPIVVSFLFYYLLRPIVHFFEKYRIPRFITILCIYVLVALFLIFFIAYMGPDLAKQIEALANTSMSTFEKAKEGSKSMIFRLFNINLDYEIEQRLFTAAQQITTALSKNIGEVLGIITHFAAILAVIPFIVFYLLKDDHDFASGFLRYVPEDFGREVRKILNNMDHTLSSYINGLVLISSVLGILLFIGYMIIGLNYAPILAMIAIVFTTIPFVGPFLAIAPAILVGLSQSPFMVVKVIVVFVIIQQCESNLISPQIIGQRLNIHPLTIILLLLAAGSLYGLIGLILATPFYALSKVLIENIYKIYQLHYSHWK
jgi:predicted PurR-regulated permease PerM